MRTVAHLFDSYATAEAVVAELEAAGFSHDNVSIVAQGSGTSATTGTTPTTGTTSATATTGTMTTADSTDSTDTNVAPTTETGAGVGASIGTLVGGGAGVTLSVDAERALVFAAS